MFFPPKPILLPLAFISIFTLLGFTFNFSFFFFLHPCPNKPLKFIYTPSKPLHKSNSSFNATTQFQTTIHCHWIISIMSQTAPQVLLVSNLYTGMSFYPHFKPTGSFLYSVHSESSNAFLNFGYCIFQFYNFTFTILYFLLFSEIFGFKDICSCTMKQFYDYFIILVK